MRRCTKLLFELLDPDMLLVSLIPSEATDSLLLREPVRGSLASMNFLFSRIFDEELILMRGINCLSESSSTPFTSTANTEFSVRNL